MVDLASIFLPPNATDADGQVIATTKAYENCVQEAEADRIDAESEAAKKEAEAEARRAAKKKEAKQKEAMMELALVANKARSGAIELTTLAFRQKIKRTVGKRSGAVMDPYGINGRRDVMDPTALAVASALRASNDGTVTSKDKASGSKSYFAKASDAAVLDMLRGNGDER